MQFAYKAGWVFVKFSHDDDVTDVRAARAHRDGDLPIS